MNDPINVPVIIIGGGGVGLTLSTFLSDEKIEHVLFEKHATTSIHPKAHYLNQRTLEIFRQHGMDQEILQHSCPPRHMHRVEWRTSLGGERSFDGKLLGHIYGAGGEEGSPQFAMYQKDSPSSSTNLPLLRLEPILRDICDKKNSGRVLFNHEVVDFVEIGDHVLVDVQTPDGLVRYCAQYVVAADGGKLSTSKLGVKMEGMTGLVDFVSTHFKADLSEYWDDRTLITHFVNPEGESMANLDCGALIMMGPTWGRKSEEWTLTFGRPVDKADACVDAEGRIRALLKIPDLEVEVLRTSHWVLDRVVADKYRQGRVFLAGDSAHRRPPTTGLGLNTGIQDAQNLAWKLAAVLKGNAAPTLLDTYESERRPVGIQNSDWALFTFGNMLVLSAATGLIPGATPYNIQRFSHLFSDTPAAQASLHHIRRVIQTQDVEYSAHGLELGFNYDPASSSTALVDDSSAPPPSDPAGQVYYPTTRPGHRLPHAWIESPSGLRVSTHDLLVPGRHDFLLITDLDGQQWIDATARVTHTSMLTIPAMQIGMSLRPSKSSAGVYRDFADQWSQLKGFKNGGAILVRPDNIVGWRSETPCVDMDSAEKELRRALETLLRIELPKPEPAVAALPEIQPPNSEPVVAALPEVQPPEPEHVIDALPEIQPFNPEPVVDAPSEVRPPRSEPVIDALPEIQPSNGIVSDILVSGPELVAASEVVAVA